MQDSRHYKSNIAALKTIIIYMLFGGLWIFFSDSIVNNLTSSKNLYYEISTIKGWFFILSTSLMLYYLIRKYIRTIQSSMLEMDTLVKHLNNHIKYANDIILLIDENEKIIDANDSALKRYGYFKDEILKLRIKDLCVENEPDLLGSTHRGELKINGEAFETLQIEKSGNVFFVEASTRIIEVGDRKFYQSIIKDITDKKDAEKSIMESKLDYKELADLLPQSVYEADLTGKFTFANKNGRQTFGIEQEDIERGVSVFDYIAAEEKERALSNFQNFLKTGVAVNGQYTAIRKDGSRFPCIIFVNMVLRQGKPVGVRGLLIDISAQKQIEDELRESEERFKLLIESLPVAVVLYTEGKITFVNAAALVLVGASTKDDLVGRNVLDFLHPDYKSPAKERINNILTSTATSKLVEEKVVKIDGTVIDVETISTPVFYKRKVAIQAVINDITWRKAAETALRDSEEKYRTLVELAEDAIFVADVETGIIIDANLKAEKLVGRKKSEIIGMHQSELHPPEDADIYKDHFESHVNDKDYYMEDVFVKHSSGQLIPVEISKNICMLGNRKVMQGIFRDLRDRRQAEDQIRILSRAVEQSPISIVIADISGNIEYVNLKFTQITGYSLTDVLGKNPKILKSGETPPEVYKQLWNTITGGKEWRGELHNKKKDGTLYWEFASISPVRDYKGRICHFLAIKEDITAMKQIANELITAKEKAEESDRMKSEFLAQISHEIRTPLNIILSYNYLLREELEDNLKENYGVIFKSIDTASKRLLRTIDLILNMSAIQSGRMKTNISDVNIYSVLKKLMDEFNSTAELKHLNLSLDCLIDKPGLKTDEYFVIEIFQNLIDNALKYTNHGSVKVVIYEDEKNQVCVDVTDTGIGIAPQYLPRLFEPFTQEETGYSRKYEGNGLGLALVKKYSEALNAEMKVKSEKDKGSTFTLVFKN